MWTSWFVLAACAVIAQSFPRPDEEYEIPDVTFGQRAQYYVLHDDGDFKYGYNTGDGAYESAVQMGSGDLTGFYGYNDAFGENVRLDYTAGVGGFVPRSSILPVAPQVGSASVRSSGFGSASGGSVAGAGVITKSAAPSRPFEEADVRSANNLDGSYSFSYDNSDSSRSESADSSNNVVGQYSFVADDGQNRQIRYRAGSATGYVAEGDAIPVAPEVSAADATPVAAASVYSAPQPSVPSGLYATPVGSSAASVRAGEQSFNRRGDASYSFKYQTADSAREESSDSDLNVKGRYSFVANDGIRRNVNYIAGSDTGFVAEGDHLPVAPEPTDVPASVSNGAYQATAYSGSGSSSSSSGSESQISTGVRSDASYAFNYNAGDSSRDETSDNNLNVKGQYSFVGDDGVTRTVQYTAGSDTGFVAEGAHLPVPVVDEGASGTSVSHQTYSAGSANGAASTGSSAVASFRGSGPTGVDASYSFSYANPDSSRSESADSDLNVRGDYSFVADDGIERSVRYRAGSGTGFVAEGDHLPVPVSVSDSGATSGSAATHQTYSAGSATGVAQTSGSTSGSSAVASFRGSGPTGVDASYSFSYANPDSSRSESADSDLNVRGDYSFVADDGIERSVRYRAGSGTGFVAEGAHLPVPVSVSAAGAASGNSGTHQTYSAGSTNGVAQSSGSTSGSSGVASVRSASGNDGSYTFEYTNSDSARSESADSSNNVVGEYSFVADDGQNRQIRYRAGSGTGFVAEGDSIPVAPEVPVVQQGTSNGASGSAVVRSGAEASSGSSDYSYQAPSVSFSAGSQAASTRSSSSSSSSASTSTGHLQGNVFVRQYPAGRSKFGYVFTEV